MANPDLLVKEIMVNVVVNRRRRGLPTEEAVATVPVEAELILHREPYDPLAGQRLAREQFNKRKVELGFDEDWVPQRQKKA